MPVDQADRTLPPPVRAGIGLVAAGVDRAKTLPRHVRLGDIAALPLRGFAYVAAAREAVERTYEELSHRGETVVARWRHQPEPRPTAQTPTADDVEQAAQQTVEEIVDPFGLPEEIVVAVEEATPGATLAHDELPLEDYDHLTLGSLRARLSKLDPVALVQLRDYERAHAHRLPVLTMLENRIAKVSAPTP
jgi:hypothetical protein